MLTQLIKFVLFSVTSLFGLVEETRQIWLWQAMPWRHCRWRPAVFYFDSTFSLQFPAALIQSQGLSYSLCVVGLWISTFTSNLSSELQANLFNSLINISTWLHHRLQQCPKMNWSSSVHICYSCLLNARKCFPHYYYAAFKVVLRIWVL